MQHSLKVCFDLTGQMGIFALAIWFPLNLDTVRLRWSVPRMVWNVTELRASPLLLLHFPPVDSDINQPRSLDTNQGHPMFNNAGVNRNYSCLAGNNCK